MSEEQEKFGGTYRAVEAVKIGLPSLWHDELTPRQIWQLVDWLFAEGFVYAHGGDSYSFTDDGKKALEWKYRSRRRP